jgi:hypothetical protein
MATADLFLSLMSVALWDLALSFGRKGIMKEHTFSRADTLTGEKISHGVPFWRSNEPFRRVPLVNIT